MHKSKRVQETNNKKGQQGAQSPEEATGSRRLQSTSEVFFNLVCDVGSESKVAGKLNVQFKSI